MADILIICSKFHQEISDSLLSIATDMLSKQKIKYEILYVPGAFEIPLALSISASSEKKKFSGYIVLGCVIKSRTPHFDYVCTEACRGIMDIAIKKNLPLGFGLITVDDKKDAIIRSSPQNPENYSAKAVEACIKMIKIKKDFSMQKAAS